MPHTFRCTDCGTVLSEPGTCPACIRKAEKRMRDRDKHDKARDKGKHGKGGRK